LYNIDVTHAASRTHLCTTACDECCITAMQVDGTTQCGNGVQQHPEGSAVPLCSAGGAAVHLPARWSVAAGMWGQRLKPQVRRPASFARLQNQWQLIVSPCALSHLSSFTVQHYTQGYVQHTRLQLPLQRPQPSKVRPAQVQRLQRGCCQLHRCDSCHWVLDLQSTTAAATDRTFVTHTLLLWTAPGWICMPVAVSAT
jgi:hypothetical protein